MILTRPVHLAAALLLVSSTAVFAAPVPRLRPSASHGAATPAAADRTRVQTSATRGIESICGTRLEAAAEILEAHAARELHAPLPTPHSTDVGEIAVLEDDGTFFYSDKNNHVIADLQSIGQAFYRTHGDDYDALGVFLSSGLNTWLGSPNAIAAAYVLRNSIQGIGVDHYDIGAHVGSASRLESMLTLNGLHRYPADPNADISGDSFSTLDVIAHEFGHRWLAYANIDSAGTSSDVLLGRSHQHWSFFFDADSSLMEGGNWQPAGPDSFIVDGVSNGYGNLDLYLMGLRSKAETPPFFTLHDATDFNPPGNYIPASWMTVGTSCDARAHFWTIDDLEAENGPRVPDAATAPHVFRIGIVLVTPRGQDATPADLAKVENLRSLFPGYFATATRGFGAVDLSLDSRAGTVAIEHTPLKDRLDLAAPVPVAANVTIDQAGIPLAVDPGSVRLRWRLGTIGPYQMMPMAPSGETYSAQIPASPGYTGVVQYWIEASSDSAGIAATSPAAGGSAPHAFDVGPDEESPVIVQVPMLSQGQAQMPVTLLARITDNVALQNAWVEWGVGSISESTPMAAAGPDSFVASIGAGAPEGATLYYRIVALDTSGLQAVFESGLQGGQPLALPVVRDWSFDFENGLGGPLAFTHSPFWFSYRDAWHPTTEWSSPPGGTSWKCGDDAPRPYPVHLDANLYLATIPEIEPGTKLVFDHRYDLEEGNFMFAWDGARVEGKIGNGAWQVLNPDVPYMHVFIVNNNPFQQGTRCWSGSSGGSRTETIDLSPLAPGPATIRFRMLADDFLGYEGWFVDQIRVDFPGGTSSVPQVANGLTRAPWPNPANGRLSMQLVLPRAGAVEWTLFDLAGRRVASLARGEFAAGTTPLDAALPRDLKPGVYLSQVNAPGMSSRVDRIAVVR